MLITKVDMSIKNRSGLYIAIAIASWSTVASAFKIGLRHYTYFELILVSAIVAMLVFAVVVTAQGKWKQLKDMSPKRWLGFALSGFLNPALYYIILFRSYDLLPAQIAQSINYFWPTLLTIMLAIFMGQSIPKFKYIGMLISFGGVVLISLGTGGIAGVSLSSVGIALAFSSAFLWAMFWILNQRNKHTDSIVALFLNFMFGAAYLLIATIFVPTNLISINGLLSGLYVGMFEMAIPFIFFGLALKHSKNPSLINQLCYLSPFMSLFIIHFVVGETIYPTTYIGLGLIVSGIILNEIISKRRQQL